MSNSPNINNQMWLATVGFIRNLQKANRAQIEDAITGAKQGMNDFARPASERHYFKIILPILRKQLKEFGARKNNPAPRFTKKQLDTLRSNYANINKIDPGLEAYTKLVDFLDNLPQPQLKQLASAHIKFVSGLASNRVIRKNPVTKKFTAKVGAQMPKGLGTILAYDKKESRVLVDRGVGYQPFVVWTIDEFGTANHGRYFKDLADAVKRFENYYDNPTRKKKVAKKKRSAKQLANDKRLGRMAKARAKKKFQTGVKKGGAVIRKHFKKKRAANPARQTRAKSHLQLIFKCKGYEVYFLTLRAGKLGWTLTKGDAILFNTKSQASDTGRKLKVAADWAVGIAPISESAATIAADCRKTIEGK